MRCNAWACSKRCAARRSSKSTAFNLFRPTAKPRNRFIFSTATTVAPSSLQGIKRQVYRALMQQLAEAMEEARELTTGRVTTPDFKEGVASFLEKRKPIWQEPD